MHFSTGLFYQPYDDPQLQLSELIRQIVAKPYPQIAQYLLDKTGNSSNSTIVGLSTPQSIQPFQVPAEQHLNKLSDTHIEQLLQLSDPLKLAFY